MKKLIPFITGALFFYACSSSKEVAVVPKKKLFVGQNKSGFLTVGNTNAPFTSTKENLLLLVGNMGYAPDFSVPEDILLNQEYEMYRYKLTKGFVIYRKNKQTFYWARVTFLPPSQKLTAIRCSGDTVSITLQKGTSPETLCFRWKPETYGYGERYVKL